jgi:transposase-like protein
MAMTEVCMSGKRYSDEFKAETAKQVIDQGRSVREVSTRLGVSIDSLYAWVREQRRAPGYPAGGCLVGGREPSSAGQSQAL